MLDKRIGERLLVSKYAGKCTECKRSIGNNEYIWYNTIKRTARHRECPIVDHDMQEGLEKTIEVMMP